MGVVYASHPVRLLTVTKTNFASVLGAITSNAKLYPTKARKVAQVSYWHLVSVLFDGELNHSPPSTSRIGIARKAKHIDK